MKLAIVIPAYNEAATIQKVIKHIPRRVKGAKTLYIIVVDDGSTDQTGQLANIGGVYLVCHRYNMGVGAATLTGLRAAIELGVTTAITLDADNQHDPKEIQRIFRAYIKDRSQLVIGSRFLSPDIKKMPHMRVLGNRLMNWITYNFSRVKISDSQSGFRLLGPKLLKSIFYVSMSGYELWSAMIIHAARNGYKITEIPVSTIYYRNRRGQSPFNGINIFFKLLLRFIAG